MIFDDRKGARYYSVGLCGLGGAQATTNSFLYLWSSATNTKDIEIVRITLSDTGGSSTSITNPFQNLRVGKITAENVTPGGNVIVASPLDQGDPASSLTSTTGVIRFGAAAPTRDASPMYQWFTGNNTAVAASDSYALFDMQVSGKPITLNASTGEGLEIYSTGAASTVNSRHMIAVTIVWREI